MRSLGRTLTYRANICGLAHLPLGVRSTGRYVVDSGWREASGRKWFCQMFWTVEGRGAFHLAGKTHATGAGEIFFYRPGDVHQIHALCDRWDYCWLTFDHPEIEAWLDGFGLKGRTHAPGGCPAHRFSQLAAAMRECTPQGERRAAHLAHAILLNASSNLEAPPSDSLAVRARHMMDANFRNPAWGISHVVDSLAVHRTTVLRTFLKHYGLTPSTYVQNRRLQKALSLLRENDLQIQEIAWQAGFSDPNYMARAVRKATGMSPRASRNQ